MATSEPTLEEAPRPLRVVGTPRRSLFDAVRPGVLQSRGERIRGPGGMALAALQDSGVTGGSSGPPDAVVLAGRAFGAPRDGWVAVVDEGKALGVAYGLASTRRRRSVLSRTWCLLRASAVAEGRTMEVAVLLEQLPIARLVPVVVGRPDAAARASALLEACGVAVRQADNTDAWSVLSALDHACRTLEQAPSAVVASRTDEGR